MVGVGGVGAGGEGDAAFGGEGGFEAPGGEVLALEFGEGGSR